MTDFAGDTTTELERKARALSVVALVETCSYLLLFYFWQIAKSDAGTAIVGSLHGMTNWGFLMLMMVGGFILFLARAQNSSGSGDSGGSWWSSSSGDGGGGGCGGGGGGCGGCGG